MVKTVDIDDVLRRTGDLDIEAFKGKSFDVTGYVSQALKSQRGNAGSSSSGQKNTTTASQEVRRLDQGIEALSEALKGEIVSKFDSLITQVACVDETGSIIASVKEEVNEIHQTTKQLTTKVREPQRRLKQLAKQLRSTRNALKLVVHVSTYLKLVKKLKFQMEKVKSFTSSASKGENGQGGHDTKSNQEQQVRVSMLGELAKAAKLLKELRACQLGEESLARVTVVANHVVWVDETWKTVSVFAKQALKERVETANYGNVGLSFQVYFNLGELGQVVEEILAQHRANITEYLELALKLKPGTKFGGDTSKGGQASHVLIQNLDRFLKQTLACMVDVWQMQRVLSNKFDPVTNASFLEACIPKSQQQGHVTGQTHLLTVNLWNAICATLSGRMATAFYKSISLKNALVSHYPELSRTLRSFVDLLQKETSRTNGVASALPNYKAATNQLLRCVETYQNAFQGASLNQMIEAVNILFTPNSRSLPTSSDMNRSIKCFLLEIQRCTTESGDLIPACIANVAKAVRMMKERGELLMANGAELERVSGACSTQQQRNIALCCRIQEVYTTLGLLLNKLDEANSKELLSNALEALKEVSLEAVAPIFRSMLEMLEDSIVHIKEENFTKRGDGSSDMSIYLSDLLMKISHCRTEYLSKFKVGSSSRSVSNEMVNSMIKKLAARVLGIYAKYAEQVKPEDLPGRKCLASDMKQIESAIGNAFCPLESLEYSEFKQVYQDLE